MANDQMRRYVMEKLGITDFGRKGIVYGTSETQETNELCIADYPTARLTLYGTESGLFWIRRDFGFTDCACEMSTNVGNGDTGIHDIDTAIAVFRTCLMMEKEFADHAGGSTTHPDKGRFEQLAQLEAAGRFGFA